MTKGWALTSPCTTAINDLLCALFSPDSPKKYYSHSPYEFVSYEYT
jgi:hypothetical protein